MRTGPTLGAYFTVPAQDEQQLDDTVEHLVDGVLPVATPSRPERCAPHVPDAERGRACVQSRKDDVDELVDLIDVVAPSKGACPREALHVWRGQLGREEVHLARRVVAAPATSRLPLGEQHPFLEGVEGLVDHAGVVAAPRELEPGAPDLGRSRRRQGPTEGQLHVVDEGVDLLTVVAPVQPATPREAQRPHGVSVAS